MRCDSARVASDSEQSDKWQDRSAIESNERSRYPRHFESEGGEFMLDFGYAPGVRSQTDALHHTDPQLRHASPRQGQRESEFDSASDLLDHEHHRLRPDHSELRHAHDLMEVPNDE